MHSPFAVLCSAHIEIELPYTYGCSILNSQDNMRWEYCIKLCGETDGNRNSRDWERTRRWGRTAQEGWTDTTVGMASRTSGDLWSIYLHCALKCSPLYEGLTVGCHPWCEAEGSGGGSPVAHHGCSNVVSNHGTMRPHRTATPVFHSLLSADNMEEPCLSVSVIHICWYLVMYRPV